jgi:Tol biopolymer transport system component
MRSVVAIVSMAVAVAVAVAVALAACGGVGSTAAPPTSVLGAPPRTEAPATAIPTVPLVDLHGIITFARAGGAFGDETVFLANADGTDELQLEARGRACCPRISPDGSTVMYSFTIGDGRRTTAFYSRTTGTLRLVKLPDETINIGAGAWSPDGRRVALQLWDDTDPTRNGAYLADPDGTHLIRLTTAATADWPADFTPDGSQVVIWQESATQSVGRLFLIDADGTGALRGVTPEGMSVGPCSMAVDSPRPAPCRRSTSMARGWPRCSTIPTNDSPSTGRGHPTADWCSSP